MIGNSGTITVCIIAQDNEDIIRRCLDSCTWADEIVLVDGGSTDSTADIARRYGAQVYTRSFDYCAHQKDHALARASSQWTFLLDSDEVIPPELAGEVRQIAGSPSPEYNVYQVPRKLIDHGRWLRCCGTYPDWQYRFFRTGYLVLNLRRAHAGAIFGGATGRLDNAIIHYSFADYDDHMRRVISRTTLSALDYYQSGQRPGLLFLLAKFLLTFWHEYLVRGGIRAGIPGLMYSVARTVESFSKYAKVWEFANGTSALDLDAEVAHKRAADLDILSDEQQPELVRRAVLDTRS